MASMAEESFFFSMKHLLLFFPNFSSITPSKIITISYRYDVTLFLQQPLSYDHVDQGLKYMIFHSNR